MHIGIIGLGIIGASMAKALKKNTSHTVLGFDIKPDVTSAAISDGTIDGELSEDGFKSCDILIIGLYVDGVIDFLNKNASKFKKGGIVTDLCGIKRKICLAGNGLGKKHGFTFIGGHPMAGREVWGYESSNATLFDGASMILTPDCKSEELVILSELYKSVGFGKITISTPEEHDEMISYTSQLAHVLSNAYVKSPCAPKHQGFSAGSFKDLTRVAFLNEVMWSRLFIENRDFLSEQIELLVNNLNELKASIDNMDEEQLKKDLKTGCDIKKSL